MNACKPTRPSKAPSADRHAGDAGVSEVLGAVLVLAILALVLVGTSIAMQRVQDQAQLRSLRGEADAVSLRVAAAAGDAAAYVTAESAYAPLAAIRYERHLDLPLSFGADGYTVAFDSLAHVVRATTRGLVVEQPLLGSGALVSCDSSGAGPLVLVYSPVTVCMQGGAPVAVPANPVLHLEHP